MPLPNPTSLMLLTISLLCTPAALADDIYGYVDANGVEHFSDAPDSAQYQLVLKSSDARATNGDKPQKSAGKGRNTFGKLIAQEAQANRLDPLLVEALISVESSHNPNARSPAGAIGLMQLMPATALRYGVADPYHPESNIRGGTRYLRDLLALFKGDVTLALAAYNAGEHAVRRHNNSIPPYAETRRYVPKVMQRYAALQKP